MLDRLTCDSDAMEKAVTGLDAYLLNGGPRPDGAAGLGEDPTGEAVFATAVAKMQEAETAADKAIAMYEYAVARDAMYAMAGRQFLKSLGMQSTYRGIYEARKTALLVAAE